MKEKLEPYFEKYEMIVNQVETLVNKIKQDFPNLVTCKSKCSDCCHALFDLTFIEALYLNKHFNKIITRERKNSILEVSNTVDRETHKLKRTAQNSIETGGKSPEQVLYEMATFKIKCPLLNSDNLCELYEFRPITCRAYGIPTSFTGKGHTCGLSGFETGKLYPTINLDIVHKKLRLLSDDLVKCLDSRYIELGKILMPISMVLLTEFDTKYLGI